MLRHSVIQGAAALLVLFAIALFPGCSDDDCPGCPDPGSGGVSLSSTVLAPLPLPSYFGKMFVAGAGDLWVPGGGGVVLRRQGSNWTQYDTGVVTDLLGIWGSSTSDVYAVGSFGTIVHWDGSSWRIVDSGTFSHLEAIHGTAANNVWAIAYDATIFHYDGTGWERVAPPFPQGDHYYHDIWCAPTGEVFIASSYYSSGYTGFVLVFDGVSSWTEWNVNPSVINCVWGTAGNDAWCGDDDGNVFRFDGSSWTLSHTLSGEISAIHGSGANDVWAASYVYSGSDPSGELARFDGTSWAPAGPVVNPPVYQSLAAAGPDEVYVRASESMFMAWDGAGWTVLNEQWVTSRYFVAIWGASAGDLWLFDSGDTAWNTDGTTWSDVSAGTDEEIAGVWGAAADNIYAVGRNGAIVRYNGTMWSVVEHGLGSDDLYAIWGTGPGDIWVGCETDGDMWHYNGTAWSRESVWDPQYRDAISLWGAAPDDYYAVASNYGMNAGGVMHYDGTTWEPVSLGGHFVKAVHGASAGEVYFLSGDFGIIITAPARDGSSAQPPPGNTTLIRYLPATGTVTEEYLNARAEHVWALGSNNVFVAGTRGMKSVVGHYDGSGVVMHEPNAYTWITGMWGTGTGTVYLCSGPGALIRVTKN